MFFAPIEDKLNQEMGTFKAIAEKLYVVKINKLENEVKKQIEVIKELNKKKAEVESKAEGVIKNKEEIISGLRNEITAAAAAAAAEADAAADAAAKADAAAAAADSVVSELRNEINAAAAAAAAEADAAAGAAAEADAAAAAADNANRLKLKDQSVILKRLKLETEEKGEKIIEEVAVIKELKDQVGKLSRKVKTLTRKLNESNKANAQKSKEHSDVLSSTKPYTCQMCTQTFTPPKVPVPSVSKVPKVPSVPPVQTVPSVSKVLKVPSVPPVQTVPRVPPVQTVPSVTNQYKCPQCDFTTNWRSNMEKHKHNNGRKGNNTAIKSQAKQALSKPSTSVPSAPNFKYKCSQCNFTTNWKSNMETHKELCKNSNNGSTPKPLKCKYCPES